MRKTLRSTATQTVRRRLPEAAAGFVRAANPPTATDLQAELTELERLSLDDLRLRRRNNWGRLAPAHLSRGLLLRVMAYRPQAEAFGDLDRRTVRLLERMANGAAEKLAANGLATPGSSEHAESKISSTRAAYEPLVLKPGAVLAREWHGRLERVTVVDDGFAWTAQPMRARPLWPSPSPARSGTAIGFSACGIEMAPARANVRTMRKGLMDAKGRAFWRAASRSTDLSRSAIDRRRR
jgi:Protein of unknown function (DUF2924)